MPPDDEWAPDPPDPDAIEDKLAYEQAVAARLASLLERNDANKGPYTIELVGSYPDTKLKVSGLGLASRRPMKWEFELWDLWEEDGTILGTGALIWANMDD